MNPKRIKPYIKAKEIENEKRQEEIQQELNVCAYLNGIYVRDALLSTVGNMFSKNSKFEYPKEPYDVFKKQEEPHELTEEEKIKKTEELFLRLNIMKSNFDLAKN